MRNTNIVAGLTMKAEDEIKFTIIKADVDVDTDSDNGFDAPERNLAENHKNTGKRPGGAAAQAGDVWYKPLGIWVSSHGQANPFFANSPNLLSFWVTGAGGTDHVFLKYNGRFYDGSYEHAGGASYATINDLADAGVSHYYYGSGANTGGKWTCDAAGVFQDTTATMPLERIWLGKRRVGGVLHAAGWTGWMPLLKVAQDPASDEMQEP